MFLPLEFWKRGAGKNLFALFLFLLALLANADTKIDLQNKTGLNLWPWASQNAAKPPEYKPYNLPRFDDTDTRHFNRHVQPLVRAPRVDGDLLFKSIIGCYPAKSIWKIDVDLRAALKTNSGLTSTADGTLVGGSYVGIVAKMPLYSTTELNRERERESRRRSDTAKIVANFVASIASRNHALRELGLYSSLEARAHTRVQQGISDATEQVKYLEKVANAQEALIQKESKIMESRLILVGMCSDEKSETMNLYLSELAQVPTQY